MHLPSESKIRVLLRIEGHTVREVGEALGLTPNGVHQHLREAQRHGWASTKPGLSRSWTLTAEGRRVVELVRAEVLRQGGRP